MLPLLVGPVDAPEPEIDPLEDKDDIPEAEVVETEDMAEPDPERTDAPR
jgi:hypothetical protein